LEHCFDVGNCWKLSRELAEAADKFALRSNCSNFAADVAFAAATEFNGPGWMANFTAAARTGRIARTWSNCPTFTPVARTARTEFAASSNLRAAAFWAQTPVGAAAIAEVVANARADDDTPAADAAAAAVAAANVTTA
jgi:hypothetical protein